MGNRREKKGIPGMLVQGDPRHREQPNHLGAEQKLLGEKA